jgi:hypothetical protein
MRHRSFFVTTGVVLLVLGSVAATLLVLIRHELEWYTRAAVPPGPHRESCSLKFLSEFQELLPPDQTAPRWYAQFTDEQINSFFEEDLIRSGLDKRLLPEGVRQLRVAIEPGRLRLAFRYGHGLWSSVISIDLGVWLAPREQNAVVIEVERFRAGALPIGAQSVLQEVTAAIRQSNSNIEVTWYRNPDTGNPCAVVRFLSADPQRPVVLLDAVQLEQGKMTIHCRYSDAPPLRALANLPGPGVYASAQR